MTNKQSKKYARQHFQLLGILIVTVALNWSPGVVSAADSIALDIGDISAEGWSISELHVELGKLQEANSVVQGTLSTLDIHGLEAVLQDASFGCANMVIYPPRLVCTQGQMLARQSSLGRQQFDFDFDYSGADDWQLNIADFRLANGRLSARLSMRAGRWAIEGTGKQLSLDALPAILRQYVPSEWELSGKLNVEFNVSGTKLLPEKLALNLRSHALSYTDSSGLQVGEDLQSEAEFNARWQDGAWHANGILRLTGGQFYSDPWYVDVLKNPLQLDLVGQWDTGENRIQLNKYQLQITDVIDASGHAAVALAPLRLSGGKISFASANVDQLYQLLVQPLLIGGALDALQVTGQMEGVVAMTAAGLSELTVQLDGVDLEAESALFGFTDLDLKLQWSGNSTVVSSSLRWNSGHLFNMQLGALNANFDSSDDTLQLTEPVTLPFLKGTVYLRDLKIGGLYAGNLGGTLSARIDGLKLSALTAALGWPYMEGEVYGDIPRIDLVPGHLLLGGTLRVGLLGGEVDVQDLAITDPFGVVPVFDADLSLIDLDLGQLTQTFSFGRIDGGLEGEVKNLQLVGWELEKFDMSLRSSTRAGLKRRISQRAIDNLTSLGNGVSGNLSNTFLRFFKDFSYSQIALELSLSGDVARIGGIDLADGGYYLVKGALLPRIDVIGRNREIAWKELVQRIKDVQLEGAVIK